MNMLIVIGAYGRVYKDAQSVTKDWFEGKDFLILGGPYCSIKEAESIKAQDISHIQFVEPDTYTTLAVILLGQVETSPAEVEHVIQ
jgi:hypothetical protein